MFFPRLILALLLTATALTPCLVSANVTLPSVFSEHMVLQRSKQTPVWGRATPGEKITVTLTDTTGARIESTTTATPNGYWRVNLDLSDTTRIPTNTTCQLLIKADNTLVIPDVLLGEVWLASGQSNMEWLLKNTTNAAEEIARSDKPGIRFFTVKGNASLTPRADAAGKWSVATPDTTPGFSAVAWYFASQLQAGLGTPVGIINASRGGTPIEAWTSLDALKTDPEIAKITSAEIETAANFPAIKSAWLAAMKPWLAANQREDRPTPPDVLANYATQPVSAGTDGWTTTSLPGTLPSERILWIRQEINIPPADAGKTLPIEIGEIVGFDTVYFDGLPIGGRALETHEGDGRTHLNVRRQYRVPGTNATAGKHTLAIRIYAPLAEAGINAVSDFTIGNQKLHGTWLLKTEHPFAPLSPVAQSTCPGPLKAPRRPGTVPGSLHNALIAPLVPYGLRGFIWYQGEHNASEPLRYRALFPLLINDWRTQWGNTDLSFYWCQLPNFQGKTSNPNSPVGWASLREAQAQALRLPRTGQAVLIDLGEAANIHPSDKREVGARLAALALAHDYGKNVAASGPVYDSMRIEGSSIRIQFKNTDGINGGLIARPVPAEYLHASAPRRVTKALKRNSPGSQLEGFALRGDNTEKWQWADARIDGDTVVVSSLRVPRPKDVRYAWSSNPTCNLYNAAGFPAAPFRTDTD
ncbi:sialate O-acetylesterase [Geminisphaera colitermitum]|uniref:sialate O-acetylesterase n=1 Tax=Geminisphaera colitermitum TaxID=1148786 RepID=UPI000158CDF2|nr:sialate O-acetylesterase [Geminisphaera colitermitum]